MAEGLKALPSTYRFTHNQSGWYSFPYHLIIHQLTCIGQTWTVQVRDGTYFSNITDVPPESTLPMNT